LLGGGEQFARSIRAHRPCRAQPVRVNLSQS
jgi:hypothetical protein